MVICQFFLLFILLKREQKSTFKTVIQLSCIWYFSSHNTYWLWFPGTGRRGNVPFLFGGKLRSKNPCPLAVEVWSLNHWTIREIQTYSVVVVIAVVWLCWLFLAVQGLVACTSPWHVGSQFPNQGSNLSPLLWKGNSLPLAPP